MNGETSSTSLTTTKGLYNNLTETLECVDAAANLKNKLRLGYTTPREEYVESLEPVGILKIARKWRLMPGEIQHIARQEDWRSERVRFLRDVRAMEQRIVKGDIAELRLKEVTKNTKMWDAIRSILVNTAEKGTTTEMSPTGKTWQRPFGPKELSDLTKAAETIGKNMNEQFKLIRGDDGEETDVTIPVRITNIHYNSTPDPAALPGNTPEALPEGVVEGEVE